METLSSFYLFLGEHDLPVSFFYFFFFQVRTSNSLFALLTILTKSKSSSTFFTYHLCLVCHGVYHHLLYHSTRCSYVYFDEGIDCFCYLKQERINDRFIVIDVVVIAALALAEWQWQNRFFFFIYWGNGP